MTWDLAPENYSQLMQDPAKLTAFTVQQAKAGSIILLHVMYDSRSNTMKAVPDIIRGLKQRGFQFVNSTGTVKTSAAGLLTKGIH